jgi:hypothetical protein
MKAIALQIKPQPGKTINEMMTNIWSAISTSLS